MGDRSKLLGTPELGVAMLKETLHAQQDLLQQLYTELDEERESAATATSEAMSMMLRLQGEKAAVEMEACQYKRIAEEKLFHAEEALDIFRELIYQKEMQIASLEFQVQAYRFKLLSMGCSDLDVSETQYPENMLTRNDILGNERAQRPLIRGNSVPSFFSKNGRCSTPREKSREGSPITLDEIKEHDLGADRRLESFSSKGEFDSYWEQIRKLDERVKDLSACEEFGENSKSTGINGIPRSRSSHSQTSIHSPHDPIREKPPAIPNGRTKDESPSVLEPRSRKSPSSTKVQDIFEVPQTCQYDQGGALERKEKSKLRIEGDYRLGTPDVQEVVNLEDNSDRSSLGKRLSLSSDSGNKSSKPIDAASFDRELHCKRPAVADLEFQQLNWRLKSLEDERITTRHEITRETGYEGLELLKEIKEQLNTIQGEVMSWKSRNQSPSRHPGLASLSEASLMLQLGFGKFSWNLEWEVKPKSGPISPAT
ncbi:Myosin-binding protein 7-like protein [Drosera capensis]